MNQRPVPVGWKQKGGLLLGPLLGVVVYAMPLSGLTPPAHTLAAILAWVVVFWITEAIPLPITAVLGAGLCVMFGLGSMKVVFASFAHPIIFLFIGSFFIAEAFVVHKLDQRFAVWLLSSSWVKARPRRVFLGVGCATAVMSMWISNTAAVAIMLPMVLGILSTLQGSDDAGNYDVGMLLLLAYAAAVGGMATMIGTPPNLIGVGLLADQAGHSLSFTTWMAVGIPLGGVMFLVIAGVLSWLYPPPQGLAQKSTSVIDKRVIMEPWTRGQVNACFALGLAIFLWLLPGILSLVLGKDHQAVEWLTTRLPKELVPIVAAGFLFVLPVDAEKGTFSLTWRQAKNIDWGTILLFGGGLTFGHLMVTTTLADSIGRGMVGFFGGNTLWSLTAVGILTALVLTELASNTAAASMLVPVVIAISQSANVSPVPPTMAVCMAASLAFVLPVSTPPNAIVYGTGRVPILRMVQAGLTLDLLGGVLVWVILRLMCPLLGLD